MPDPSAFHRVGPTLQRQNQHYNAVIRRVISTSRSHIWPYTSGARDPPANARNHTTAVEHSTPATHHHHRAVSRSLTLDQALRSISADNGRGGARVGAGVVRAAATDPGVAGPDPGADRHHPGAQP